jgi:hypothetical protein
VNLAHPFAHEPCSGLEPWPGVVLPCRAQRGRYLAQFALVSGFKPPWASS